MKYCVSLIVLLTLAIVTAAWPENVNDVVFGPERLYVVTSDTTLVTRDGKAIALRRGTRVRVTGFTQTQAYVISRKGRPNGFVKRDVITLSKEDEVRKSSPSPTPPETTNQKAAKRPSLGGRVSASPYGGSVGLGPVDIHIGSDGKVFPGISLHY